MSCKYLYKTNILQFSEENLTSAQPIQLTIKILISQNNTTTINPEKKNGTSSHQVIEPNQIKRNKQLKKKKKKLLSYNN